MLPQILMKDMLNGMHPYNETWGHSIHRVHPFTLAGAPQRGVTDEGRRAPKF